jgi:hypothetical protein
MTDDDQVHIGGFLEGLNGLRQLGARSLAADALRSTIRESARVVAESQIGMPSMVIRLLS